MTKALVDWAKRICKPRFLDAELRHLKEALQTNGYSAAEAKRAVRPRRSREPDESVCRSFLAQLTCCLFGIWHIALVGCYQDEAFGGSSTQPGKSNSSWDWWRMPDICCHCVGCTVFLAHISKYTLSPWSISAPASVNTVITVIWARVTTLLPMQIIMFSLRPRSCP